MNHFIAEAIASPHPALDRPAPHYTPGIEKRRPPNPQERRQELCDAAIEVLADEGSKGLSHIKVDRRAGVPDGTTSVHYRTRKALVLAVAARVAELDGREFSSAMDNAPDPEQAPDSVLSRLAATAMASARAPMLARTKARFELLMQASRDPDLMDALRETTSKFATMSLDAVKQLQPAGAAPDSELIRDQAFAITTFIGGLQIGYVFGGERAAESTAKLYEYLHAIIDGIARNHRRNAADGPDRQ